jgi:hypothetical protein
MFQFLRDRHHRIEFVTVYNCSISVHCLFSAVNYTKYSKDNGFNQVLLKLSKEFIYFFFLSSSTVNLQKYKPNAFPLLAIIIYFLFFLMSFRQCLRIHFVWLTVLECQEDHFMLTFNAFAMLSILSMGGFTALVS